MGQEIIGVGAAANDRNGDPWRTAMIKCNSNFTELYALFGKDTAVYCADETDFPTYDAGDPEIILEANVPYIITADFSTSKRFVWETGASWTSRSIDGPKVTFTGSGTMFSGVNNSFYIHDALIDPGIGNEAFSLTDNLGHTSKLLLNTVEVSNCLRWGTFTGAQIIQAINSNSPNAEDGCVFVGSDGIFFSFEKFALISTNAGFKGMNLGSSVAPIVEFTNLSFTAPAGAFGISGLASSGNLPANRLAMVKNCEFSGGMTDLENITTRDVRWRFRDNSPTEDTIEDALLSFNGSSTETVIGVGSGDNGNPIKVTATWTCIDESFFTCNTNGRGTFIGERDIRIPIDLVLGLISSGGGSIDVTVYLAKNGAVISESATTVTISGSNQQLVSLPWQDGMTENDFYEAFIENNTNTTNIIVESGKMRFR